MNVSLLRVTRREKLAMSNCCRGNLGEEGIWRLFSSGVSGSSAIGRSGNLAYFRFWGNEMETLDFLQSF